MKKTLTAFCALILFGGAATAQQLTVNGQVKDEQGNAVALAFVQDKKDNTATRTDSVGHFSLKANSGGSLIVSSAGYNTKKIDVNGNTDLIVVLSAAGNSPSNDNGGQTPATNDLVAFHGTDNAMLYTNHNYGASLPQFNTVGATQGSRYLFKDWVQGAVTGTDGKVYNNPKYGFNYDKMSGGLYMTQDKRTAIIIDPSEIKSFVLYNTVGQPETFEYVPDIDKTHYPILLSGGKNYKIYKLISTKFIKANYQTDGMTSTGNNYDEYDDEYTYYVLNEKDNKLQELRLKKKSLKEVFADDSKKLQEFMSGDSEKINDEYLKQLGAFLNQ